MDAVDTHILNILRDNARISNAELARTVGMAPSAVLERVRKLERKGVIERYEARINPKEVGLSLTAFTFVHVEEGVGTLDTGQKLAALPEVLEAHYTAGSASYLLKLRVSDTEGLAQLLQRIGRIEGVRDTNSTIVLRTLKETSAPAVVETP
ncbi:Lrp/AsnC family transcriptional regulator [Desulfohalovibrio reitneri]|uniref:Lrp/AsnC family transcriptional regulator n=1 Tax=Desulfohalovibrio reitneri TaxID=1307759 RepID=UPI0004A6A8C2|nr:Lrp/AsnC family transcriptional regulator [Desulfohalovibrio reitneri]